MSDKKKRKRVMGAAHGMGSGILGALSPVRRGGRIKDKSRLKAKALSDKDVEVNRVNEKDPITRRTRKFVRQGKSRLKGFSPRQQTVREPTKAQVQQRRMMSDVKKEESRLKRKKRNLRRGLAPQIRQTGAKD